MNTFNGILSNAKEFPDEENDKPEGYDDGV
jgi:hypothetical protein